MKKSTDVLPQDKPDGFKPSIAYAKTLKELTARIGAPVLKNPKPSVLKEGHLKDPSKAHSLRLKLAAVQHVLGLSPIKDPAVIKEIEKRFDTFPLYSYTAPDITVTAQNPLIIDSTSSVTDYNTVTIEGAGYIVIKVACLFQCKTLVRSSVLPKDDVAGTGFDFMIQGFDGKPGKDGSGVDNGKAGLAGSDAECDGAGGCIKHEATNGSNGTNGPDGSSDTTNGSNGDNSPTVVIKIEDLTANISVLNIGGQGGKAGNGGVAGTGGAGGKGGASNSCGACYANGGNGGDGGNGGNGGNGANGGDGGDGGDSVVHFKTTNGSMVFTTNSQAEGGSKGAGGAAGLGGDAGASGGNGGSPGKAGNPGSKKGDDGHDGNRGSKRHY